MRQILFMNPILPHSFPVSFRSLQSDPLVRSFALEKAGVFFPRSLQKFGLKLWSYFVVNINFCCLPGPIFLEGDQYKDNVLSRDFEFPCLPLISVTCASGHGLHVPLQLAFSSEVKLWCCFTQKIIYYRTTERIVIYSLRYLTVSNIYSFTSEEK